MFSPCAFLLCALCLGHGVGGRFGVGEWFPPAGFIGAYNDENQTCVDASCWVLAPGRGVPVPMSGWVTLFRVSGERCFMLPEDRTAGVCVQWQSWPGWTSSGEEPSRGTGR